MRYLSTSILLVLATIIVAPCWCMAQSSEFSLSYDSDVTHNAITYNHTAISQPKSQWIALGYAILPGYFIPAALGHAYAEAKVQAAVVSSARLSGRLMWMYAFFDNFWVERAQGSISGGAMGLFYGGLVLDLGGYLYDILHAPAAVAKYNKRFTAKNETKIQPFIDMVEDGPYCGLALNF